MRLYFHRKKYVLISEMRLTMSSLETSISMTTSWARFVLQGFKIRMVRTDGVSVFSDEQHYSWTLCLQNCTESKGHCVRPTCTLLSLIFSCLVQWSTFLSLCQNADMSCTSSHSPCRTIQSLAFLPSITTLLLSRFSSSARDQSKATIIAA